MFPKKSILILSLVALAGCSTSYKNTTDYKLCYSQATYPSYNIHQGARAAEVKSRSLDCRVYADRIDEEQRAIDLAEAGATRINNSTTIQQPIKWKNETVIQESTTLKNPYIKEHTMCGLFPNTAGC